MTDADQPVIDLPTAPGDLSSGRWGITPCRPLLSEPAGGAPYRRVDPLLLAAIAAPDRDPLWWIRPTI